MIKIDQKELGALLAGVKQTGHIFSIKFEKKDGSIRDMVCRFKVKKHLKHPDGGGKWANGKAGSPEDHHICPVFDVTKGAYRCFNVDRVRSIKIDHKEFQLN